MTPVFAHLYSFALACIFFVAPHATWKDVFIIADASAYAAEKSHVFSSDASGEKTVAHLIATAQGESSMRVEVTGDGGKSFGPFEIFGKNLPPREAALESIRQMRVSYTMCRDLTAYFAGKCIHAGLVKERADYRERVARRLYAEVAR